MKRSDCVKEKLASRTIGFIVLPLGLFLGFIGGLILPVVGFFLAIPLLIFSAVMIMAPESKACRLITGKFK